MGILRIRNQIDTNMSYLKNTFIDLADDPSNLVSMFPEKTKQNKVNDVHVKFK